MKKSVRFCGMLFMVVLMLGITASVWAGGSSDKSSGSSGGKPNEDFISMGTSSSGGTFNTLGVAICQMWTGKVGKTQFSAEVTGGSSENCVRVGNGEIKMAFAAASSVYEAVNGLGQFKDKKIDSIRAIANLYPAIIQLPVLKSSGIKKLDDIVGKKINIGQARSGSEAQSIGILDSYGISTKSFSAQQLSHSNASDALLDEKIDGYFISGSLGQSHQMKAMASGKGYMASLEPKEKIAKLIKDFPYYYAYSIPKGTYPNQDYDVATVATGTLLIVNKDVSDELVYEATKALFANVDALAQTQKIASEIKLESALNVSGVTLHPGAVKFYKEKGLIK